MAKKVEVVASVITDTAKLTLAIDSIASRGKKLDKDIHQAAVSTLVHAGQHGDVTLASRLIAALPASGRRNALIAWFVAYGPFAIAESGKDVVYHKRDEPINVSLAWAEPYWEFAPEPQFVAFDFGAVIAKAVKLAEKALADSAHAGQHKVTVEQLSALRALVPVADEE